MDAAIAKPIQANQTSDILARPRVIVAVSIPPPRGGRSLTSRAAIVASSDGLQFRPGTLSNTETSAFSAVTLDIAERRAASSHGSTLACANAERTVSCVPLGASSITARRKSLHSGDGIEAKARSFMMSLPLSASLRSERRASGVELSEFNSRSIGTRCDPRNYRCQARTARVMISTHRRSGSMPGYYSQTRASRIDSSQITCRR